MRTVFDSEKIERERLKRGWTRTELARRINVTLPTVSRIESGQNQSPKTVRKIAAEFGIRLESLVK